MKFDAIKSIERENYDVIVVGGGIAGIAAAVSAAREGMKTFLIEKSFNLGGLATGGLISWYEPLCDGKGNQMIFGIAEELIKLSAKYSFDTFPSEWGGDEKNAVKPHRRYGTYFSPTVFSAALDKYVLESGAKLRFDTLATYPVMEDNICKGVIVESVNGREFFGAKIVIDATGDATIMHRAGVPTVMGKNYITYMVHYFDTDGVKKLYGDKDINAFRKWYNMGSNMNGVGHPEGKEMVVADSSEVLTDYMTQGKLALIERIKEKDRNCFDVMALPSMPQLRTIRRIVGKCDFEAIDKKTYCDSIGTCGDFRPTGIGKHYQIPFGALYNDKFPNLLAAGRIISAPQGDAWEVSRVIPVCALTGEAAGKAAAKCVTNGHDLNNM